MIGVLPRRRHAAPRPAWLPTATALGALLVAYAAWQLSGWPSTHRNIVGDLFFFPVELAAVVMALRAARRCAARPRVAFAWRMLSIAALLYFAGEVTQTVYELRGPLPFPSLADVCFLLFCPAALWGLLSFPIVRLDGGARVRLGLDLAVVAIGGAMLVTYAVLGPTLRLGGPDALSRLVSIAYPVRDMVLLVGLGAVLLRCPAGASARALQFLAGSLTMLVLADLVYGYIQLHSAYQGGDLVDSLWIVAISLFALAGAAQGTLEADAEPHVARERDGGSWVPNVAVAVGFALVIADHHDAVFVVGGVVMASLVTVRQLVVQRDLIRMQRQANHQSQHDSLTQLPNRRRLITDLAGAVAAAAPARPWTLAMFDLDGFKGYNDSFGHLAGDQLLSRMARRLRVAVAPDASAYRLGGDEFCVLVAGGGEYAAAVIELAGEALSEVGGGFAVRPSCGVVSIPADARGVSSALHLADTRMYSHKNRTRASTVVSQTRDVLLRATGAHDASLPRHMLEVGRLARDVARRMGLDAETVELTLRTGELHDVGKIAIPESILAKPGTLSESEWSFVRQHSVIGERVLEAAPALAPVARIVRSTHERFDGAGYPDGLRGDEIPLPARIVLACDTFHAMLANRPYAPPLTESEARAELLGCAGSQLDPEVVGALLAELDGRPAQLPVAAAGAATGPLAA
jgi:diguanylate cyclase (GGDEF)-like protein